MKWSLVLLGFLVPVAVVLAAVEQEWGHKLKAVEERGSLSELYADEPFYPPDDPTASATLGAARFVWDRLVDEATVPPPAEGEEPPAVAEPLSQASLRQRFPDLAGLDDGRERILSLYVATPGAPLYPQTASLKDGLLTAMRALFAEATGDGATADLRQRARFKLDQVVGGYRDFPWDGGYSGVALDEGLDGIRLRHDEYLDFYYLPSWSIEHKVARRGIHGRARKLARQLAGWKKSRTKKADFAAFRTRAWVEARHGGGPALPVARGNTDPGPVTPALLRLRIELAAEYLERETGETGKMTYGYKVEQDEDGTGYNLLRHAGAVYAMLQAYRVEADAGLLEAAGRGIAYYRTRMRQDKEHPGEWYVLDGKRAKLGGIALGLCMMVEMERASPGTVDHAMIEGMARHIERMQLPSGELRSFYDWNGKGVTRRKSIYYSGEALLGLVRTYELTGNTRWLDVAEKGADFLVNRRWVSLGIRLYVPLDAWLIQALEELDRVRPNDRRLWYAFELSEAIARRKLMDPERTPPDLLGAGLSGVGSLPHAATAGAFGEALAAAARLEARRRPGEHRHRDFAIKNAGFQLRNQFTDANDWFVPNPPRALGAFRERPDDSKTRNDHVQHNLSGLFGLLDLLDESAPDIGQRVATEGGQP